MTKLTQIRSNEVECTRNNVTLAEFLNYAKRQCEKKGGAFDYDLDHYKAELIRQGVHEAAERLRREAGFDLTQKIFADYPEHNNPYHAHVLDSGNYGTGTLYEHIGSNDGENTNFIQIVQFDYSDEKRGIGYFYQCEVDWAEEAVEVAEEATQNAPIAEKATEEPKTEATEAQNVANEPKAAQGERKEVYLPDLKMKVASGDICRYESNGEMVEREITVNDAFHITFGGTCYHTVQLVQAQQNGHKWEIIKPLGASAEPKTVQAEPTEPAHATLEKLVSNHAEEIFDGLQYGILGKVKPPKGERGGKRWTFVCCTPHAMLDEKEYADAMHNILNEDPNAIMVNGYDDAWLGFDLEDFSTFKVREVAKRLKDAYDSGRFATTHESIDALAAEYEAAINTPEAESAEPKAVQDAPSEPAAHVTNEETAEPTEKPPAAEPTAEKPPLPLPRDGTLITDCDFSYSLQVEIDLIANPFWKGGICPYGGQREKMYIASFSKCFIPDQILYAINGIRALEKVQDMAKAFTREYGYVRYWKLIEVTPEDTPIRDVGLTGGLYQAFFRHMPDDLLAHFKAKFPGFVLGDEAWHEAVYIFETNECFYSGKHWDKAEMPSFVEHIRVRQAEAKAEMERVIAKHKAEQIKQDASTHKAAQAGPSESGKAVNQAEPATDMNEETAEPTGKSPVGAEQSKPADTAERFLNAGGECIVIQRSKRVPTTALIYRPCNRYTPYIVVTGHKPGFRSWDSGKYFASLPDAVADFAARDEPGEPHDMPQARLNAMKAERKALLRRANELLPEIHALESQAAGYENEAATSPGNGSRAREPPGIAKRTS